MTPALTLALSGMVVALGSTICIELRERHRRLKSWRVVRLQFSRDVSEDAAVALVSAVAGLARDISVVFEIRATRDGIEHRLGSDQATIDTLAGRLRAVLPRVRLDPVEVETDTPFRLGRSVHLRGRARALRQDELAQTNTNLLAAMQPLRGREVLLLRWLVASSRATTVTRVRHGELVEPEERRRLRMKNDGPVVRAVGTVAVAAGHSERAAHLLSRITAVLRSRATAYGRLSTPTRSAAGVKRALRRRSYFFIGERYAAKELAALLALPIEGPVLPGVSLGTSPVLMPSNRLPRSARVYGIATWPGAERPVAQPVLGAMSHNLITGPTGVGKSTLLTSLMLGDIEHGRGALLIDGKGDTAKAVLERLPENRRDVIVLDCASAGPLPGLRLFGGADPQLAADVVLGVLSDLFRESWGVLSERYLRAGLVAVAQDSSATLADVAYVFTDAAYRRKLVGRMRDPLTRATFANFEAMSAGERQQQLAAPLGKLGQLLGRPVVRTVLGQQEPQLDFRRVLARQQTVIVSLTPARIGAPAARLVAALLVFAFFQAVQSRISLPEAKRRPYMVFLDEPRALGDLPMPVDALLEQARGLGVSVTLSPQSLQQLPKRVRDAALTNVATRIVFRQDADDARLLARDLRGVSAEELGDLAAFEAVARIGIGPGDLAPLATIRTVPLQPATADAAAIQAASEQRYGETLERVDEALEARHRPAAQAPVGRIRRTP
ncbi:type IV secretory system conjugative DNA transfer family protein [Conexibacter sp. CPCC 206217]|uniref:type IV secretory system conjugative DNA transfer family protein n=1 Tax=Conexibacter sp. CPCC 206217 TaxID=3064574 RepID=UPI00271CDC77|nr:type IV secretion system DNA-binding domain-containing protein [Conexibacter sp. CPCC 206217]MDO8213476.1 hypothetical protein [Conexibacter sp. CPCC 206217]